MALDCQQEQRLDRLCEYQNRDQGHLQTLGLLELGITGSLGQVGVSQDWDLWESRDGGCVVGDRWVSLLHMTCWAET